jgi:hypothetical protein
MEPKSPVEINQVYQDTDARRIERHVRVLQVTDTDALVRSCLLNGSFCEKTPKTWISLNRSPQHPSAATVRAWQGLHRLEVHRRSSIRAIV